MSGGSSEAKEEERRGKGERMVGPAELHFFFFPSPLRYGIKSRLAVIPSHSCGHSISHFVFHISHFANLPVKR